MVAVRQSHTQLSTTDFNPQHWIEVVGLSQLEQQAILPTLQWCQQLTEQKPELLIMGCDMVEILVELSMDTDSLHTALMFPAYIEGLASKTQIEKRLFCKK